MEWWAEFFNKHHITSALEIGVFSGDFCRHMLANTSVKTYFCLDPWRELPGWEDKKNEKNRLKGAFKEFSSKIEEYGDRVKVLRGTTLEQIDKIPNYALDFIYIDGDHSLKGIVIDSIKALPKIRHGGFMAGDDYRRVTKNVSEVSPYIDYFATAQGLELCPLPFNQWLIKC